MIEHIIFKGDSVKIIKSNDIYTIKFDCTAHSIINSLLKTRIIRGGSTDETYKSIMFKAESVEPLLHHKTRLSNSLFLSNAVRDLTTQLNYLIIHESCTILGYTPEQIIVINGNTLAYLGSEFVAKLDDNEMTTISYPFTPNDFFISPELLYIKVIPANVHYKISYFSLGVLLIYMLLNDTEFYKNYLIDKQSEKILDVLNTHPIKNTRLYWLISRCLVEEPKNRSITLI